MIFTAVYRHWNGSQIPEQNAGWNGEFHFLFY